MPFEIEMRAVLSKEKYGELFELLPKKMHLVSQETLHTIKYKPGDVRLRWSDKKAEIVSKDDAPAAIVREELVVSISKDDVQRMKKIFAQLGIQHDHPWTTERSDFSYVYDGHSYDISLQHVHNFAYILEVEVLSDEDESSIHQERMRKIITDFDCEPVSKKELLEKITAYRVDEKNKELLK